MNQFIGRYEPFPRPPLLIEAVSLTATAPGKAEIHYTITNLSGLNGFIRLQKKKKRKKKSNVVRNFVSENLP